MLPRPEASLLHFKSSGRSASVSDSVGGGTWGQRVRARAAEECAASSESLAWEKSRERMEQGTRRTGVNSSGLAGCGPTPGPTPTRPCPQGGGGYRTFCKAPKGRSSKEEMSKHNISQNAP